MTQDLIARGLRGIAVRLTSDLDVQKDLVQEMFVHFMRERAASPDQTLVGCFQSCENHAREHLRLGRQAASLNGTEKGLPATLLPSVTDELSIEDTRPDLPLADEIELDGELIANDVLVLLLPLLSDMQQHVLFLLMSGSGVREAGRQLGISHPAVIKHRRKIAHTAHELLQETEGIGVAMAAHDSAEENGNGNWEAHTA